MEDLTNLKKLALKRNGISISKARKNAPFKIEAINISVLQSRIPTSITTNFVLFQIGYCNKNKQY